jgi:hypothetical protein
MHRSRARFEKRSAQGRFRLNCEDKNACFAKA